MGQPAGTGGSSASGSNSQPMGGTGPLGGGNSGGSDVGSGGVSPESGATSTGGNSGGGGGGATATPFKVLVLSTSLEFGHDSIPVCQYMLGVEQVKNETFGNPPKSFADKFGVVPDPLSKTADANLPAGADPGSQWTADRATDDLAQFTDANLAQYAMVFFCSPTGTVFSNNPKVTDKAAKMAAFQKFVENGGAWGGVHSATDFEKTNGFPWFTNTLAGAYFVSHDIEGTPGSLQADTTNKNSVVLQGVNASYATQDEWYKMNRDISAQPGFLVLQRLASDQRPLTWIKEIANPAGGTGGRMFYTARGHAASVYKETEFRNLVLRGVLWATRRMK